MSDHRVRQFERALLMLDASEAQRVLEEARAGGSAIDAIEGIVAPALEHIGQAWEEGTIALSQVYMGGRLCEQLVDGLVPEAGGARTPTARIAIATLDDYHLLGKRIVLSALRASGFAVLDYGRATADEVSARAAADAIEVLLLSTLMLPSALRVKQVRALLTERGSRARVVVGGAPFRLDPALAREVGADATGKSSGDAIAIVRSMTGGAT